VIVLDTSAWLAWTSGPSRLSARAVKAISEEEKRQGLLVSAISIWEVSVKSALGKLVLDRDVRAWVHFASSYPGVSVVPVDASDAMESTMLPGHFHEDPADRLIIALARRLECPIVTGDPAMRAYRYVKTIW
jgi:PIN domain nuclease of toxin-antitoxin system